MAQCTDVAAAKAALWEEFRQRQASDEGASGAAPQLDDEVSERKKALAAEAQRIAAAQKAAKRQQPQKPKHHLQQLRQQPQQQQPPSAPASPIGSPKRGLGEEFEFKEGAEEWERLWEEKEADLVRSIGTLHGDRVLSEVLSQSRNLKQYAADMDAALEAAEEECIEQCVANADAFASLYNALDECEGLVSGVRDVVWGFKEHLSSITGDIRELQSRSSEISEALANREGALLYLSPVLQKLDTITPEWIRAVVATPCEAKGARSVEEQKEVEDAFLRALRQLDEKLNFLSEDPHLEGSFLQRELRPQLLAAAEKLCGKVEKLLRAKFAVLKAEGSNVVIQQQALAHRCAFAFRFLRTYSPEAAERVAHDYAANASASYVRSLRKTFEKTAHGELQKVVRPEPVVPRDMFDAKKGTEAEGRKLLSKVKDMAKRDRVTLPARERARVLAALAPEGDELALDPSVMVAQTRTVVEDFTRMEAMLVNRAVHEASFISEYFTYPATKREELLVAVFEKSVSLVQDQVAGIMKEAAGDHVAILLLLRICECMFVHLLPSKDADPQADPDAWKPSLVLSREPGVRGTTGEGVAQRSMKRAFRPPGFVIRHLKDVQAQLWGLYHEAVGAHLQSVRDAAAIRFAPVKNATTERASSVHPVVLRYVQVAGELHHINTLPMAGSRVSGGAGGTAFFSDTVVGDAAELLDALLALLDALERRMRDSTPADVIHAANNLSAALDGLIDAGVSAQHCTDIEKIDAALRKRVRKLTEIEVEARSPALFKLLGEAANVRDENPQTEEQFVRNRKAVQPDKVVSVVGSFHSDWQSVLADIQTRMAAYFPKKHTAQYVLRCAFEFFVDANDQLRQLVYRLWREPPCRAKLISREVLDHEIKTRYMPSF